MEFEMISWKIYIVRIEQKNENILIFQPYVN
jgi:hypothetical protein